MCGASLSNAGSLNKSDSEECEENREFHLAEKREMLRTLYFFTQQKERSFARRCGLLSQQSYENKFKSWIRYISGQSN